MEKGVEDLPDMTQDWEKAIPHKFVDSSERSMKQN